jgi:hypothetical protein
MSLAEWAGNIEGKCDFSRLSPCLQGLHYLPFDSVILRVFRKGCGTNCGKFRNERAASDFALGERSDFALGERSAPEAGQCGRLVG